MGWGTLITMCQRERVPITSQAEGSLPGKWGTVCRGRAFGNSVKIIISCLKGTVGMWKIYYGVIRGSTKGREMEVSR